MVVGITSDQTCLVLRGRLRVLQNAGFAVVLISSPGRLLTTTVREEGVEAHPIRMKRGITPIADLLALAALWTFLRHERPLITDFSTPKAGLLGNLAAWSLGVPHRVYTLRGLKLESASGWKRSVLLWTERLSAACAHVVLCNSESLWREAIALRLAPESKLHMLGRGSSNGVDTERFHPGGAEEIAILRAQFGIAPGEIVLGFVGRLTRDKGIPELLTAFDAILRVEPNCRLLLVGWFDSSEDALAERWRHRVATHPKITHTGYLTDASPAYRAMDMLVLPTHREGFPNVALEASASGIAVITTESTGARDAVLPEVTGLLIPPAQSEAIVEAALKLILNPALRSQMGAAGREWVSKYYLQAQVLSLATQFYRGLLTPEEISAGRRGAGTSPMSGS
jgi:glycosyltransferase involved in cell wall biosynthesis